MARGVPPPFTCIQSHYGGHPDWVGLAPACRGKSGASLSTLTAIVSMQGPIIRHFSYFPFFCSHLVGITSYV